MPQYLIDTTLPPLDRKAIQAIISSDTSLPQILFRPPLTLTPNLLKDPELLMALIQNNHLHLNWVVSTQDKALLFERSREVDGRSKDTDSMVNFYAGPLDHTPILTKLPLGRLITDYYNNTFPETSRPKIVAKLMDSIYVKINQLDTLRKHIMVGDIEALRLDITNGADFNDAIGSRDLLFIFLQTPNALTSPNGLAILQLILEQIQAINCKTINYLTKLHTIPEEALVLLMNFQGNVAIPDSLLIEACKDGSNVQMMQFFLHKGSNPLAIIDSRRTSTLEYAIKHNQNTAKVIIEHCAQNNTLMSHLQENEVLLKLLCSNTEILDFTLKSLGFDALAQRASDVHTQYKDAITSAKATHEDAIAKAHTKHQGVMKHVMHLYRQASTNPDAAHAESINAAAEKHRRDAASEYERAVSVADSLYKGALANFTGIFDRYIEDIIDGVRANDPTDYTDPSNIAPVLPLGLDESSDDIFDPT